MAIAKRKKKFFDVEIPLINKQTHLQAYEIEELNGRFIKYDLTRLLRGKNMIVSLRVVVDEDKNATTIPREIKLLSYFIKRMVRKGRNYVEDSFSVNCKNAQIRIKPFMITRRKVSRAVRKGLRDKAKEELIEYVKDKNFEDLFRDILNNQLQKPLSLKLKKIYPLSLCEIRILKVEKEFEKPIEEKVEIKENEIKKNEEVLKEKIPEKKTEEISEKKKEKTNPEEKKK